MKQPEQTGNKGDTKFLDKKEWNQILNGMWHHVVKSKTVMNKF